MGQVLAICDDEKQYACRLAEYFNQKQILPFEVMAFDDREKLENYMSQHKIAVLLMEAGMFYEQPKALGTEQLILLSEARMGALQVCEKTEYDLEAGRQEKMELPHIYKYQSAEEIAKALLEICSMSQNIVFINQVQNRPVKLIGIYSPVGRCLQTSFSLVLGQLLAARKKCLYINMEPYSGFNNLFGRHYDHNMSELIYFLTKGTERFVYKLKSTIEKLGNLEYIPPAESFLDLVEVEKETWQRLIEEIIRQTEYEVIVMDLSDYVSGLLELLQSCDHVYTIIKKDGIAMAKLAQYEQMLSFTHHETLLSKTKKIGFPIFKELPKQIEQLPYSELAEYTKKLIQEDAL